MIVIEICTVSVILGIGSMVALALNSYTISIGLLVASLVPLVYVGVEIFRKRLHFNLKRIIRTYGGTIGDEEDIRMDVVTVTVIT